jgi:hypothetical protein
VYASRGRDGPHAGAQLQVQSPPVPDRRARPCREPGRREPEAGPSSPLEVSLTEKGRKLVERIAADHLANERALLAPLSKKEQQALAALFGKLLVAYEEESRARLTRSRRGISDACQGAVRPGETTGGII